MKRALLVLAACSQPAPPPVTPTPPIGSAAPVAPIAIDAPAANQEEILAAIQKAINDLDEAAQQCWAAAATARFDIEGELAAQIDIGQSTAQTTIVRDTTKSPALAKCVVELLNGWHYAPPLRGQTIQLPFKFSAPDGQSVIDRRLVPWVGQSKVSIAVLLDENNTGNEHASMFEVAIEKGAETGMRKATRAELWYFLGDAEVDVAESKPLTQQQTRGYSTVGFRVKPAAGSMMYVPVDATRNVRAAPADLHAVVVVVPGGREGSARAGALDTPEKAAGTGRPTFLKEGKTYGPATIFVEEATVPKAALAASILAMPAGAAVPEHVHANETELLYLLEGSGTMTIAGTQLTITEHSVVQIPPNTKHAFVAAAAVRALQIYTPPGPEQRFKKR